MGLFDFLSARKTKRCFNCNEPLLDRNIRKMNNRVYCPDCYNKKWAMGHRDNGGTFSPADFEMLVDDVFSIKNVGVALTGTIQKGVIHRNDTVMVNQANYTVTRIDVIPNEVDSASAGTNAGLTLNTMDASKFRRGDRITARTCAAQSTFICDVCKKELPIKYRRKSNICADCVASGRKKTASPVEYEGSQIHIDSRAFTAWLNTHSVSEQYESFGSIPLTQKDPVILLYEDGVKTREYCLQTEGDENFSNKYFLISVRLSLLGTALVPVAQIDGFISDTPEDRQMKSSDIGYRMEGHFLSFGGASARQYREMTRGQDLPTKALKYPGYTTPSNVRLIGICPDCGKSFAFHGYAFYMAQNDVAYSDDGLDCCEIQEHNINKETWVYETDGKTFRYYNSFNCPHCRTPYIDYKKYPKNKVFGVSGCVHLGRKAYRSE